MSRDLVVVTSREPEAAQVRRFIQETYPAADIDGDMDANPWGAVLAVSPRATAFEIDGPIAIEPDDVDKRVLAFVLAPRWKTELHIAADATKAGEKAFRSLASYLAKSFDGAVFDPQSDNVVWPAKRQRMFTAAGGEDRIEVVSLVWKLPYAMKRRDTGRAFLDSLRRQLPEGLPRRFGRHEPFQGKLERDGIEGFLDDWDAAAAAAYGDRLLFSATAPCFGGRIGFSDPRDGFKWRARAPKCVSIGLDLDGRAFQDERWCLAVERLFLTIAEQLGAFYALTYVEQGWGTSRNRLWADAQTEGYPLPRADRWLGIPPVPGWLIWFGGPYAERLRAPLADHIWKARSGGYALKLAPRPASLDRLRDKALPLPAELVAARGDDLIDEPAAEILAID